MQISVPDPVTQTYIFFALLAVVFIATLRRRAVTNPVDTDTTQELKGFAILAIVFAHVGYFLATDTRFLFPLSVLAGVGVDLFLFLSGFGLTMSAYARDLSIGQFYARRLKKIYVPLWIILTIFSIADYLVLHIRYPWHTIVDSFIGWFPHADLFKDVDSPLWYISLIVLYYLLFPLVFSKRRAPVSAAVIYIVTIALLKVLPNSMLGNIGLYQLHLMAFPLGMSAAWLVRGREAALKVQNPYLSYTIVAICALLISYLAFHSGVGAAPLVAETISIVTCFFVLALFVVKPLRSGLLYIFGALSFEVYLIHWPILYRYGYLFRYLPAWLALVLYLALFLILGWTLHFVSEWLTSRRKVQSE